MMLEVKKSSNKKKHWKGNHLKGKQARASIFTQWILLNFPHLDPSQFIIDVAGGKGELAFQLHTLRHYQTIVIDPRSLQLTKSIKRYTNSNHLHTHTDNNNNNIIDIKWGQHEFQSTLPFHFQCCFPSLNEKQKFYKLYNRE